VPAMDTESLEALHSVIPAVDASPLDRDTIRVLLSDAPDPMESDRGALLVDCNWAGVCQVVAEFEGAQRFVMPTPPDAFRVVTPGGTITTIWPDGHTSQSWVVPEEEGPLFLGVLTCSLTTNGAMYLGGMSRQVYQGDLDGHVWTRADGGVLDQTFSDDASAFYGLAGTRDGDIVAVGGKGEIWRRRNGRWEKLESGTNLMLNAVTDVPDLGHFVCGAGGIVLCLVSDEEVEFIDHPLRNEFLSAVCYFAGSVFLAAPSGLHSFQIDARAEYSGLVPGSEGSRLLVAQGDVLWAVGPNAIGRREVEGEWDWRKTSEFVVRVPT
jgi:hypothetical protein